MPEIIRDIAYTETDTYGSISSRLGNQMFLEPARTLINLLKSNWNCQRADLVGLKGDKVNDLRWLLQNLDQFANLAMCGIWRHLRKTASSS